MTNDDLYSAQDLLQRDMRDHKTSLLRKQRTAGVSMADAFSKVYEYDLTADAFSKVSEHDQIELLKGINAAAAKDGHKTKLYAPSSDSSARAVIYPTRKSTNSRQFNRLMFYIESADVGCVYAFYHNRGAVIPAGHEGKFYIVKSNPEATYKNLLYAVGSLKDIGKLVADLATVAKAHPGVTSVDVDLDLDDTVVTVRINPETPEQRKHFRSVRKLIIEVPKDGESDIMWFAEDDHYQTVDAGTIEIGRGQFANATRIWKSIVGTPFVTLKEQRELARKMRLREATTSGTVGAIGSTGTVGTNAQPKTAIDPNKPRQKLQRPRTQAEKNKIKQQLDKKHAMARSDKEKAALADDYDALENDKEIAEESATRDKTKMNTQTPRNLVAKHAHKFNKAATHRNRFKDDERRSTKRADIKSRLEENFQVGDQLLIHGTTFNVTDVVGDQISLSAGGQTFTGPADKLTNARKIGHIPYRRGNIDQLKLGQSGDDVDASEGDIAKSKESGREYTIVKVEDDHYLATDSNNQLRKVPKEAVTIEPISESFKGLKYKLKKSIKRMEDGTKEGVFVTRRADKYRDAMKAQDVADADPTPENIKKAEWAKRHADRNSKRLMRGLYNRPPFRKDYDLDESLEMIEESNGRRFGGDTGEGYGRFYSADAQGEGQQLVWKGKASDTIDDVAAAFDAEFGEGSFAKVYPRASTQRGAPNREWRLTFPGGTFNPPTKRRFSGDSPRDSVYHRPRGG